MPSEAHAKKTKPTSWTAAALMTAQPLTIGPKESLAQAHRMIACARRASLPGCERH